MLKRHLENILTYFESYITNVASEGLNLKIQSIKANAQCPRISELRKLSNQYLFFLWTPEPLAIKKLKEPKNPRRTSFYVVCFLRFMIKRFLERVHRAIRCGADEGSICGLAV